MLLLLQQQWLWLWWCMLGLWNDVVGVAVAPETKLRRVPREHDACDDGHEHDDDFAVLAQRFVSGNHRPDPRGSCLYWCCAGDRLILEMVRLGVVLELVLASFGTAERQIQSQMLLFLHRPQNRRKPQQCGWCGTRVLRRRPHSLAPSSSVRTTGARRRRRDMLHCHSFHTNAPSTGLPVRSGDTSFF